MPNTQAIKVSLVAVMTAYYLNAITPQECRSRCVEVSRGHRLTASERHAVLAAARRAAGITPARLRPTERDRAGAPAGWPALDLMEWRCQMRAILVTES